jgi:hypothetical protein
MYFPPQYFLCLLNIFPLYESSFSFKKSANPACKNFIKGEDCQIAVKENNRKLFHICMLTE